MKKPINTTDGMTTAERHERNRIRRLAVTILEERHDEITDSYPVVEAEFTQVADHEPYGPNAPTAQCSCGAAGLTAHFPGPAPLTSSWCYRCYLDIGFMSLMDEMFSPIHVEVFEAIATQRRMAETTAEDSE